MEKINSSDTGPTWTVWPCEHGGVQVEAGNVPPHHQCAACGEKPIAVVPRHELVDVIARLAKEAEKRKTAEFERDRYKAALERIRDWPTPDFIGPAMAVAREALNGGEHG